MTMFLVSLLFSAAASAETAQTGGVAIVINIPDDNAALRAVAAGAVDAATKRWGLLNPPIKPEEVDACGAIDVCLNNLAKARGASHLFVVGIANLGEGEVVVSLKLFDSLGADVLTYTDVIALGSDPRGAGAELVGKQIDEITDLPSPGDTTDQWPPPPAPIEETYSGLSLLSGAGWALVGSGAVVAVAAISFGALQSTGRFGPVGLRDVTALVATPVVLGLIGTGLVLATVDIFTQ